jgi:hypothetical protein
LTEVRYKLSGGWVGGWGGKIVIPMPEALSFAESRRQKMNLY